MTPFSDDEIQMFANEMNGGEFAELLLIDMHMVREADAPPQEEKPLKGARAAIAAANAIFDVQVEPSSNCIKVDFAAKRLFS